MIPLMFAAIGGGLATASVVAPLGALSAVIAAPFGGSFCAVLAAFHIARQRSAEWQGEVNLDEQADAMVPALRGLAAQAKQEHEGSAERAEDGGRTKAA